MKLKRILNSRFSTVIAAAAVLALVGGGSALAAGQITTQDIQNETIRSADIKNGTIQKRDLTVNNFKKFTETANVNTRITPDSTVEAYAGAPVVDVPASPANGSADSKTTLLSMPLDKGTYVLEVTSQFWHLGGAEGVDLGVTELSVPSQDGFPQSFTADVPDNGNSPAQATSTAVVKIAADDTIISVLGSIRGGGDAGQAGATVVATKVAVK